MNWVMEHMSDPDFSSPFTPPNAASGAAPEPVDEESMAMIISMGFTVNQAKKALKVSRARDMMNHLSLLILFLQCPQYNPVTKFPQWSVVLSKYQP